MFTEKEIRLALAGWQRPKVTSRADQKRNQKRPLSLKEVREALQISTDIMADRLNITRPAYWKLERSDERTTITVQRLRECSAALGCELVVEIRSASPFEDALIKPLLPAALEKAGWNRRMKPVRRW